MTPSAMKDIISGMRNVLKRFNDIGYDKVFTLLRKGDKKGDKLISIIGFKPIVYYTCPVGTQFIKYEMRTH